RNLTAGQKARFLTVVGDQVRLGEALEQPLGLQRANQDADVVLRVEREDVQKIAEREAGASGYLVENRRRRVRRNARDPVLVALGTREDRGAGIDRLLAVHFGEAHLKQHLLALAAAGDLEQVDHLRLRRG